MDSGLKAHRNDEILSCAFSIPSYYSLLYSASLSSILILFALAAFTHTNRISIFLPKADAKRSSVESFTSSEWFSILDIALF